MGELFFIVFLYSRLASQAMNRSVAEFFARNELAEVLSAPHAVAGRK